MAIPNPSNPTVSASVIGSAQARRIRSQEGSAYTVAAIRDWLAEVREVATYDLQRRLHEQRAEAAEFDRFGIWPGVRHTSTIDELIGRSEALRKTEEALNYLIRDLEEAAVLQEETARG